MNELDDIETLANLLKKYKDKIAIVTSTGVLEVHRTVTSNEATLIIIAEPVRSPI